MIVKTWNLFFILICGVSTKVVLTYARRDMIENPHQSVQSFVSLYENTTEDGCLMVYDGSHKYDCVVAFRRMRKLVSACFVVRVFCCPCVLLVACYNIHKLNSTEKNASPTASWLFVECANCCLRVLLSACFVVRVFCCSRVLLSVCFVGCVLVTTSTNLIVQKKTLVRLRRGFS